MSRYDSKMVAGPRVELAKEIISGTEGLLILAGDCEGWNTLAVGLSVDSLEIRNGKGAAIGLKEEPRKVGRGDKIRDTHKT